MLISRNNKQTTTYINNAGYSDEELVHIKIPVLLPYSANWSAYERYDGEVEYGGIHYNYVKRKIYNDTLHLLCLPNFRRTRLQLAENNYTRQVNDVNSPSTEKTANLAKKNLPSSEYDQPETHYPLSTITSALPQFHTFVSPFLTDMDRDCLIHPPDCTA